MRLSEKTIEINYCSQVSAISKNKVFWFGLTQKQEAEAGFDVCAKFTGRLVILQFKASNLIVRQARRFMLDHLQMVNLKKWIKGYQRSVFYVLPLIGNSYELGQDSDLIQQSRLLDISRLPRINVPTTKLAFQEKIVNTILMYILLMESYIRSRLELIFLIQ